MANGSSERPRRLGGGGPDKDGPDKDDADDEPSPTPTSDGDALRAPSGARRPPPTADTDTTSGVETPDDPVAPGDARSPGGPAPPSDPSTPGPDAPGTGTDTGAPGAEGGAPLDIPPGSQEPTAAQPGVVGVPTEESPTGARREATEQDGRQFEQFQGVEAHGVQGSRTYEKARELEQRVIEENPNITEPWQVAVVQEDGRLVGRLTEGGAKALGAQRVREQTLVNVGMGGIDITDAGLQVDEDVQADIQLSGIARALGVTPEPGADLPPLQQSDVLTTRTITTRPGSEPDDDAQPDVTGAPDRGELEAVDRRLFPDQETETVGAAGPMGVTVPTDRDPAISVEDVQQAGADVLELFEGGGGETQPETLFEGQETETVGAAGPMGVTVPTDREPAVTVQDLEDALAGIPDSVTVVEGTGEGGPVTVPEGAPGVGVATTEDPITDEEFQTVVEGIEQSLAPTEPVGVEPESDRTTVGAAGPMGVTLPEGKTRPESSVTVSDIEQAGEDVVQAMDEGGSEPVESVEVFGGQGTETVGAAGPMGVTVPEDRKPSLREETVPTTRVEWASVATAPGEAIERSLSDPSERETINVQTDIVEPAVDDLVVTEEEADALPDRAEEFGDFDPVVAGVAVEPTLRRGSEEFRDITGAIAEESTDAVGLEEGGFADVTAETALTTFPEIFNAPGLAVDTLEIAETGAFVAGDPEERAPLVVEEAERQAAVTAEFLQENPAVGAGAGLAVLAQIPTSLATLRGMSAISPRLARAQDIAWNTPERVARRSLFGSDSDPLDEVRTFGDDLLGGGDGATGGGRPGGPGGIDTSGFRIETQVGDESFVGGGSVTGGGGATASAGLTATRAEPSGGRAAGRGGPGQQVVGVESELGVEELLGEREAVVDLEGERQRVELAEGRQVDPGAAEIETRPEFSVFPEVEAETALRAETEIRDLLGEAEQPRATSERGTGVGELEFTALRERDLVDVGLETELEAERELSPELEVEAEAEPERELELEQELEREQERELEAEQELESEFEPEPGLKWLRGNREPRGRRDRSGFFDRLVVDRPGDPDELLGSLEGDGLEGGFEGARGRGNTRRTGFDDDLLGEFEAVDDGLVDDFEAIDDTLEADLNALDDGLGGF